MLARRLIRQCLIQFCLGFDDFGLHHRHDVRHVRAEFLYRRFSDRLTIKVG
jgi:hypothetical protein